MFAPTIGLFIAKISKGRTIRQMAVGAIFFGSLGCAAFFIVLGNYGLYLQLTGTLDVVNILNTQSPTATIFAILDTLPMAKLVIAVFTLLAIIFTATTFDSISYILASVVQHEVDDEPHRWNRLFWAFTLCLMPAALMFIGGLSTLQTASIFAGAPTLADYEPDYALHHQSREIRFALPARLFAQNHPHRRPCPKALRGSRAKPRKRPKARCWRSRRNMKSSASRKRKQPRSVSGDKHAKRPSESFQTASLHVQPIKIFIMYFHVNVKFIFTYSYKYCKYQCA